MDKISLYIDKLLSKKIDRHEFKFQLAYNVSEKDVKEFLNSKNVFIVKEDYTYTIHKIIKEKYNTISFGLIIGEICSINATNPIYRIYDETLSLGTSKSLLRGLVRNRITTNDDDAVEGSLFNTIRSFRNSSIDYKRILEFKFKAGIQVAISYISKNYELLAHGYNSRKDYYIIVYKIPEIVVTNGEEGKFHIIRDVIIYNNYHIDGDSSISITTYISRCGYTRGEIASQYFQSHVSQSSARNLQEGFLKKQDLQLISLSQNVCLGNNPLRNGFVTTSYKDFKSHEIMVLNTLNWESLKGGPYIGFYNVKNSSTGIETTETINRETFFKECEFIINKISESDINLVTTLCDVNVDHIKVNRPKLIKLLESIVTNSEYKFDSCAYATFKSINVSSSLRSLMAGNNINVTTVTGNTSTAKIIGVGRLNTSIYDKKNNREVSIPLDYTIYPDTNSNVKQANMTVNPLYVEYIYTVISVAISKVPHFDL